jgi:branched-chain amino acid transport system permease protein
MRVSGIYFLMITLAIGQMFCAAVWSWRSLTGGDDGILGIRRPILGLSLSSSNEINFFHFILIFFIICLFLLYRIANSPFGFTLLGIRNDEIRMRALGYNTWRYKYFCYVISGVFGSLAGALKVYQDGFVNPSYANVAQSGLVLLMVLIGGSAFFGPIIGAIIVTIAAHIISSYTEYWLAFLGVILILSVMFFPEGIAGYFTKIMSKNPDLK